MLDHLLEPARAGRLVVVLGPGLPDGQPTSVPSLWLVNEAMIDALGRRLGPAAGESRTEEYAGAVLNRQLEGRLRAETPTASAARRDTGFASVLACLDGESATPVHLALAALAKAGRIAAIVTGNVDRSLESALTTVGAEWELRDTPGRIAELGPERAIAPDTPCQLLKLNGSAKSPAQLAMALSLIDYGVPPATADVLRALLRHAHWLVAGTVGAEFYTQRNWLYLRSDADDAVGLTWLLPPGSPPHSGVRRLMERFGERGRVVHGDLPEVLNPLTSDLELEVDPIDVEALRKKAAVEVEAAVARWADDCSRPMAAAVMGDLLVAADRDVDAMALLRKVRRDTPDNERKDAGYSQVCASLGRLFARTGDRSQALDRFKEALRIDEELGETTRRGEILFEVAEVAYGRSDYKDAKALYKQALAAQLEQGDARGRARTLNELGVLYKTLDQPDKAMRRYEEALELRQELRDEEGRAETMLRIAGVYRTREENAKALESYGEALGLLQALDDDRGVAMARFNMALLYRRDGDVENRALGEFVRAYRVFRETGSSNADRAHKQIEVLINDYADRAAELFDTMEAQGPPPFTPAQHKLLAESVGLYRDAFEAARITGEMENAAKLASNVGMLQYSKVRDFEAALRWFRKAFEIFRAIRSPNVGKLRRYLMHCERKLKGLSSEDSTLAKYDRDTTQRRPGTDSKSGTGTSTSLGIR